MQYRPYKFVLIIQCEIVARCIQNNIDMGEDFTEAVNMFKKIRARFDQRQVLKHEFELFIRFEEETYALWGLHQQSLLGNINVPKLDYFDPEEQSWMWGWIKGNRKWHAWNDCKGISQEEAERMYVREVEALIRRLPLLIDEWKDDQDPQIPDRHAHVPKEEKEERERITNAAKEARRRRDAEKRREEEALGMWDE